MGRTHLVADLAEAITTREADSIKIEAEVVSVASEIATTAAMLVDSATEMDSVMVVVVLPAVSEEVGLSVDVMLVAMGMDSQMVVGLAQAAAEVDTVTQYIYFLIYSDRPPRDDSCKMFIGGLPHDATENSIRSLFDSSKVKFVKHLSDKCIAFVEFDSVDALEAAVAAGPYSVNGRDLRCNKAGEKSSGK